MNTDIPDFKSEFVQEKSKLLSWIGQWTEEVIPFEQVNFDIPEMAILLQSIGFQLKMFEMSLKSPTASKYLETLDKHEVKVEVTCSKSETQTTWNNETATCSCMCHPEEEESSSQLMLCQTSFFPKITPTKNKIIKALLFKIYTIIKDKDTVKGEIADATKAASSLPTSCTLGPLEGTGNFLLDWNEQINPFCEEAGSPSAFLLGETSSSLPDLFSNMNALNSEQIAAVESIDKFVDEAFDRMRDSSTSTTSSMPDKN